MFYLHYAKKKTELILLRKEEDFELFGSTILPQKYMSVLTKDRNGNTYRRPIISPEKARKKRKRKTRKNTNGIFQQ